MKGLTEALDTLAAATEATDAVRSVLLESANVSLPAFLAQALSLGVLASIACFFVIKFRKTKETWLRLVNGIAAGAAGVAVIAILFTWIDYFAVPRSAEIIGHIQPAGLSDVRLDLLDYQGKSLGANPHIDRHGAFSILYSPQFADPPRAILASARGCDPVEITLRRHHLIDSQLSISLVCGGTE